MVSEVVAVGGTFTVVGLVLSVAALWLYVLHRRRMASLVTATGRVVEVRVSDVDGQTMYQPVVELRRPDGSAPIRVIQSGTYHGTSRWAVGDAHPVHYDPRDPEKAILDKATGTLFAAQMCGLFGGVLLPVGIVTLLAAVYGPASVFGRIVQQIYGD